nr:glycoside hydrolase family 95 protein [Clostridia bacterium]
MKQSNLILKNPATEWENCTPIGNGFSGAMIEGRIALESLQLNEERIWSGKKIEIDSPDFRRKIDEVRRLLLEGKALEADRYCTREFAGDFHRVESYETAGELLLKLHDNDSCEDYSRILDLKRGIANVSYKKDGTAYSREYFASYPKKLTAMRITSDGAPISLDASLFRKNLRTKAEYGMLKAEGRPMIDGRPFTIAVKFKPLGGRMYAEGSILKIRNAKTCDIFISIVTDGQASVPENIDYEALKAEHIADFTALTGRCEITLPDSGIDEKLAVNERLDLMKRNGTPDNRLTELYFDFGRYLLISSSRPGSLPANLQGVWNGYYKAPWNADYHTNINLQMNYWPAEVTSLGECALPLFDYINENMLESGRETAEKLYKCRGAVLHHVSDIYGYTAPADGVWGLWPLGGAWLCYHLWEHYLYTLDTDYLRDTAYPYISECARFFLDYMFEHEGIL